MLLESIRISPCYTTNAIKMAKAPRVSTVTIGLAKLALMHGTGMDLFTNR